MVYNCRNHVSVPNQFGYADNSRESKIGRLQLAIEYEIKWFMYSLESSGANNSWLIR